MAENTPQSLDEISKSLNPNDENISSSDTQKSDDDNFQLDKLQDTPSQEQSDEKIDFSQPTQSQSYEDKQLSYWKKYLRILRFLLFSTLFAVVAYAYSYYIHASIQPLSSHEKESLLTQIHNTSKDIAGYVGNNSYSQFVLPLTTSSAKQNLESIVQSSLSYIDKKYILEQEVESLVNKVSAMQSQLDDLKENTSTLWFLSPDIYDVLTTAWSTISVQRAVMAIESIKFTSAVNVFSQLDSFTAVFSQVSNYEPTYIQDQLAILQNNTHRVVDAYLTTCFLNPFELPTSCNATNDFVNAVYAINESLDPKFIVAALRYMHLQVEQTTIPQFSVTLQNYDPNNQTITFNLSINTFPEDERYLLEQWVVNPHLHLVGTIVDTIKQNKFIVWSAVSARNINVTPRVVTIGSNQIRINASVLNFTLPLQRPSQTEIFDNR